MGRPLQEGAAGLFRHVSLGSPLPGKEHGAGRRRHPQERRMSQGRRLHRRRREPQSPAPRALFPGRSCRPPATLGTQGRGVQRRPRSPGQALRGSRAAPARPAPGGARAASRPAGLPGRETRRSPAGCACSWRWDAAGLELSRRCLRSRAEQRPETLPLPWPQGRQT